MKPLLSVLIISYNQEEYIEQAILGAINQKCNFPFEIVIGEDCSSDKTLDICNQYQERYPDIIKVIGNKTNKGLLDNYFDTLLLCQGKYIADCAGDDFWTDEYKIQRQFDILENNSNVSLTYTNYSHYIQESNTFIHNRQLSKSEEKGRVIAYQENIYKLLNQHNYPFIFVGSSCFRKNAFLESYEQYTDYFRNTTYTCEDFQLTFFLFKAGDFYYENKETVAYRIISNTISRQLNLQKQFRYTYGVFQLRTNIISQFEFDPQKCREYITSDLIPLLSLTNLLNLKDEQKHIIQLCKNLNYQPTFRVRCHLMIGSNKMLTKLFTLLNKYRRKLN